MLFGLATFVFSLIYISRIIFHPLFVLFAEFKKTPP